MTKTLVLALTIALLAVAAPAWAFTCTPTECTFEFDYTEPSTLAVVPPATVGAPLTDLANAVISYQVSVDGGAPGPVKIVTVPASTPAGGVAIKKNVTDASMTAGHKYLISGATVVANRAAAANAAPSAPGAFNTLAIDQTIGTPANTPSGPVLK